MGAPSPDQTPQMSAARNAEAIALGEHMPYLATSAGTEVSRLVTKVCEEDFGLSVAQWRILALLSERHIATSAEICQATGVDKVTISRSAHDLTRRNLIEGQRHQTDGRSHYLSMTDEGRQLFRQVRAAAVAVENALSSNWTAEELDLFKRQLRQLRQTAALLGKLR